MAVTCKFSYRGKYVKLFVKADEKKAVVPPSPPPPPPAPPAVAVKFALSYAKNGNAFLDLKLRYADNEPRNIPTPAPRPKRSHGIHVHSNSLIDEWIRAFFPVDSGSPVKSAPVGDSPRNAVVRRHACPKTNVRTSAIRLQSGFGGGYEAFDRASREAHQRAVARKRLAKAEIAGMTKDKRAMRIRAARLEKEFEKVRIGKGLAPNEADFQSGVSTATMLGCAGAGAALTLLATRVLTKADKVVTRIGEIVDAISSFVDTIKKQLKNVAWAAVAVCSLYYLLRHTTLFHNKIVMAGIVACGARFFGAQLWDVVKDFFHNLTASKSIAFESGGNCPFSGLLAAALSFAAFQGKPFPAATGEFMKRIALFSRAADGFEGLISWAMSSIESCINWLRNRWGLSSIALQPGTRSASFAWMRDVDRVACVLQTASKDVDPALLVELRDLIIKGHSFKDIYRGMPQARPIEQQLARAVELLHPHLSTLMSSNNLRVEPIAIMLSGDSGVGKTLLSTYFNLALLKLGNLVPPHATRAECTAEIFQKGTSEYWNGYASQKIMIMDDAFQAISDYSDKDNEFINIIRMIACWSLPLNFADLASKGRIFFNSKVVFGTTNATAIDSLASSCILEPAAVARRLKYTYRISVKPEFRQPDSTKLDYTKFKAEVAKCASGTGLDCWPFHVWDLVKLDFLTGSESRLPGDKITLRELLVMAAADVRDRANDFVRTTEGLDHLVDNICAPDSAVFQSGGDKGSSFFEFISDTVNYVCPILYSSPVKAYIAADKQFRSLSASVVSMLPSVAMEAVLFAVSVGGGYLFGKMLVALVNVLFQGLGVVMGAPLRLLGIGVDKTKMQSNRPETVRSTARALRAKRASTLQGGAQSQTTPCVPTANVYANGYRLENSNRYRYGTITFLVDRLAVMPMHFLHEIREHSGGVEISDLELRFTNTVQQKHSFTMSASAFLALETYPVPDRELCFVMFKSVRAHASIVQNVMSERSIPTVPSNMSVLSVAQGVSSEMRCTELLFRSKLCPSITVGGRSINKVASYSARTLPGYCGSPLCVQSTSYQGAVFYGIHIAGNPDRAMGYSTILDRELVNQAMAKMKVVKDNFLPDIMSRGISLQSSTTLPFTEGGSFLPLYTLTTPIGMNPVSKYYPVRDLYDPKTKEGAFGRYEQRPAPLSPVWRTCEDGMVRQINPMERAVAPYQTPVLIFDEDSLRQPMFIAMQRLTAATEGVSRRIYSFDEAVLGVPEEKFRSIPRGTSAGFPYRYDVSNGKKEFFGYADEYDLSGDLAVELRGRVEHVIASARNNERLSHVFIDFLKDELRSPAKVEAVATRLISSAPLDYVIAFRQYFGAFSAAVMRTHTMTGMAPGICTYTDWGLAASVLQEHGEHVFDGDFKAFDSSEQGSIHDAILDYVNWWYNDGEENARIRSVLWLELTHSRHVGGIDASLSHIYQWNKSLPSGHPFTTICNSMYSLFCLVAAYGHLTGSCNDFWKHVSPLVYGDDNVSNVADELVPIYNQRTVATALRDLFDMVYTPGRKDGIWYETCRITDVTFLKRRFIWETNEREMTHVNCPLELDSFLYTSYWCKNKKLESDIIIRNLASSLEELSMHSPELWDKYAPLILEEFNKRGGVLPTYPTRRDFQQLIHSRDNNWY